MSAEDRSQPERAHLRSMKAYVPGAQPDARAIKLNTNENPFPPSPRVMAALAAITARSLQRYPDPLATAFRETAADLHQVSPEEVVATNGGDELLRLAVTTFVDPGRAIGVASPSYGVYSVLAEIHRARLSVSTLTERWAVPADAAQRWNADGAQMAILTNPHAPSGSLTKPEDLERLAADFKGILLVDEAYADFIDPDLRFDSMALATRLPNVLVLRTLSKGYALAGLRLAYGVGSRPLVEPMLAKTKDSYNVDAVAQALGIVALQDNAYAQTTWDKIRKERIRLAEGLEALGFSVAPSQTNFVLAAIPAASLKSARILKDELEARGVYVRWFDESRLENRLRISVGTREENSALLTLISDLMKTP